eukprot:1452722-Amphidinium_carterae.1
MIRFHFDAVPLSVSRARSMHGGRKKPQAELAVTKHLVARRTSECNNDTMPLAFLMQIWIRGLS